MANEIATALLCATAESNTPKKKEPLLFRVRFSTLSRNSPLKFWRKNLALSCVPKRNKASPPSISTAQSKYSPIDAPPSSKKNYGLFKAMPFRFIKIRGLLMVYQQMFLRQRIILFFMNYRVKQLN